MGLGKTEAKGTWWPGMEGGGGGQGCQGVLTGAGGRSARHLWPVTPSLSLQPGGRHCSGLEGMRPRRGRSFPADPEGQERAAGSEGPSGFLAGALGGTGSREKRFHPDS